MTNHDDIKFTNGVFLTGYTTHEKRLIGLTGSTSDELVHAMREYPHLGAVRTGLRLDCVWVDTQYVGEAIQRLVNRKPNPGFVLGEV